MFCFICDFVVMFYIVQDVMRWEFYKGREVGFKKYYGRIIICKAYVEY